MLNLGFATFENNAVDIFYTDCIKKVIFLHQKKIKVLSSHNNETMPLHLVIEYEYTWSMWSSYAIKYKLPIPSISNLRIKTCAVKNSRQVKMTQQVYHALQNQELPLTVDVELSKTRK